MYLIVSAKEACIVIFVLAFVLRSMDVHVENVLVLYNSSKMEACNVLIFDSMVIKHFVSEC